MSYISQKMNTKSGRRVCLSIAPFTSTMRRGRIGFVLLKYRCTISARSSQRWWSADAVLKRVPKGLKVRRAEWDINVTRVALFEVRERKKGKRYRGSWRRSVLNDVQSCQVVEKKKGADASLRLWFGGLRERLGVVWRLGMTMGWNFGVRGSKERFS